jgi:predicted double-glycine peptidase
VPFHGWGMEDLRGELEAGRPVVVSLGANPSTSLRTGGDHEPGHTVTGVSADGEWVSYNDPTLGKQVILRAEFERLWGSHGNSGVAVRGTDPGRCVPAPVPKAQGS